MYYGNTLAIAALNGAQLDGRTLTVNVAKPVQSVRPAVAAAVVNAVNA